jgi:RimJ/RimL family protein N-acetyltransferase
VSESCPSRVDRYGPAGFPRPTAHGTVGGRCRDREGQDGCGAFETVCYWVRSSARGRGVATAAVQRLRNWGFGHTALIRIEVVIAIGNRASLRVAEKAGATREGTLRSRLLLHGTAHDAAMFSFIRT